MKARYDDGGPDFPEHDMSPLVEKLLCVIEESGMPQALCDQIVAMVEKWEFSQLPEPQEQQTEEV